RVYEQALTVEMRIAGIGFEQQRRLQGQYRGSVVGNYIADFVVLDRLILEFKALSQLTSQHDAQLMNYLKATRLTVGLLINSVAKRKAVKINVNGHDDR